MDWIAIDRDSTVSLTDQLFLQIRNAILDGFLPGGTKLPPTRQLSLDTGISRNIVVIVYEQLTAESYIEAVRGKGTFVKMDLVLRKEKPIQESIERESSKGGQKIIDFTGGIPDLNLFPVRHWLNAYKSVLYNSDTTNFSYPKVIGQWPLREEIAKYLLRSKGMIANPKNIIITGGSTHNFTIISEVLNQYNKIVIEDPFLASMKKQFVYGGKELVPVRVDREGLIVQNISCEDFDFVLTTPSHQYPLAVTLSARRRVELISLVNKLESYVLEDDYDSEFRYEGNSLSTLYSISPEHVIYSGTFSKSVSPALRIGYLIVPSPILERVREYVKVKFLPVNKLEQLALTEFIRSGGLERDLAKKKKVYYRKFVFLKQAIRDIFGDEVEIQTNNSGLHLIVYLKELALSQKDIERLRESGLNVQNTAYHAINPIEEDSRKIIVAFSNITEDDLFHGLQLIKNRGL